MKYTFGVLLMFLGFAQSIKALPTATDRVSFNCYNDNNSCVSSTDFLSEENNQRKTSTLVRGIDVFGTSQITAEQVRQTWGEKLIALSESIYGQNKNPEAAERLYKEIVTGIQTMGDFAYVNLAPVMDFQEGNPVYITVDIVDTADASVRMPFRPAPTRTFPDPDNLLQQWAEYEKATFALGEAGELRGGYENCPALACSFGFEHPQLQAFPRIFEAAVPRNRDRLVQILRADQNPTHRGYAVFLLAFTNNATSYVQTITPAIRDSSSLVRNNALRVLVDIAQNHLTVEIPIEAVVQALHYPDTTDRNKAAIVLEVLAKQTRYREVLIEQAVPILLEMLKLEQPNNHKPAYAILTTLSGKQYGERDYAAWERWATQARQTLK
jgi:hypothetical protein